MVEPKQRIEVSSSGECRLGRYYQFPSTTEPDLRGADVSEEADAAVSAALRRQLASDVPVGT